MLTHLTHLNNTYLITPKILYFFINLQFYTLHQFRGNFVQDKFGISKATYGFWLGILLFVTFFTNITIATLNDRFNKPKLFMITLLLLSCFGFQLFYLDAYIKWFPVIFWLNLMFYLMVNTSTMPLLDKITIEGLQQRNVEPKVYGKQRMFGTVGYLTANLLIEKLISTGKTVSAAGGKPKKVYDFDNLMYYQLITTIIAVVLAYLFITHGTQQRRGVVLRSWKELLKNQAYMFFIFIILLNGITRAAMTMYLTLYFTDIVKLEGYKLPGSWPGFVAMPINIFNENPLATTAFFGVILELVILFKSQSITNRFGLYWPLLFAQVFQLLRFVCYFSMNTDASHAFVMVCMFELMKGLNFGLTHASAVQIATMLCPPHLKTTSQMIYSGTFTGLASAIAGAVFGGVFKQDQMGGAEGAIAKFRLFYLINIGICLFSVALFVVKYGMVDRSLSLEVLLGRSAGEDEIDQSGKVKRKETSKKENRKVKDEEDRSDESEYEEIRRRDKGKEGGEVKAQ